MAATTSGAKGPGHAAAELFWRIFQEDMGSEAQGVAAQTSPAIPGQDVGYLNRLGHAAQSIAKLKDTAWWHRPEPTWQEPLDTTPMGTVYALIARNAATGILHAHNGAGDERYVAFVAGQPFAAATPHKGETLGAFLLERGILADAAAREAQAFIAGTDRPVGWAILALQLVTPERLFRAQQEQTHSLIQEMLWWSNGVADFYDNSAAVDLRRIVDLNFARVLRDAMTPLYVADGPTLRTLTAPFFARKEALEYTQLPDTLADLLDHVDAAITDCARHHQQPELLLRAVSGRPPPDLTHVLADVYVLNVFGALTFPTAPKHVRLPPPPAAGRQTLEGAPAAEAPLDPLAAYQAQKEVLAQSKKALYAYDFDKALNLLAAYLRKTPAPTADVAAYYSLALLLQGDLPHATEQAARAMRINNQDALAHAALARVQEGSGNSNGAYHRKLALSLSQNNPAWYNEVNAALNLNPKPVQKKRSGEDEARLIYLWMAVAIALLTLFSVTTVFHLTEREYYYRMHERFFYVRRAALFVVGAVGLLIYQRKGPIRALRDMRWRISSNMVMGALLWGAIVGISSPVQRVTGAWGTVMGLTVLHVLAEEMFFRGFITRMLLDQIPETALPLLLSGIIYGTYHLTYHSFWFDMGIQPRSYYVGLIALFAGYPYAWFMRETKTVVAPFLCHLAVHSVMMLHSLVHRDGWPHLF